MLVFFCIFFPLTHVTIYQVYRHSSNGVILAIAMEEEGAAIYTKCCFCRSVLLFLG